MLTWADGIVRVDLRGCFRNKWLVSAFVFVGGIFTQLFAQNQTSTLSGTLSGPSGAPISGAKITLLSREAGIQRQAISEEDGSFIIPLLAPGIYKLCAYSNGFALVRVSQIALAPGEYRNLQIRFRLKPVHESVSVYPSTGDSSATLTTTVGQHLIEELPVPGGSFPSLFLLTPGIVMMPSTDFSANDHPFSFNGQPINANYFTVDGVAVNTDLGLIYTSLDDAVQEGSLGQNAGYSALGTTLSLLPANSLSEIDVQTATSEPMLGRQAGGHIELTSRSGTSEFHGDLAESFRNSALDARDWFALPGTPKASLQMNDFSGTVGGPLWPRSHASKRDDYFFLAYEGLRLNAPTTQTAYVPDLRVREYAPTDLRPYLNAFPLPNGPDYPGTGSALYRSSFSLPSRDDAFGIRMDSRLRDHLTAFVHYSNSPSSITATETGYSLSTTKLKMQALTVGGTWIINPHVLETFRANYSWNNGSTASTLRDRDGAVIPQKSVLLPVSSTGTGGSAAIYNFLGNSYAVGDPLRNVARQQNIVNDLTFTHGPHSFSIGIDYLRSTFDPVPLEHTLNVRFTSLGSVASGRAVEFFVSSLDRVRVAQENLSLYAQDSWRAGNRLKVSYGARWEVNPALHAIDGKGLYSVTGPDIAALALSNDTTPLYKTRLTNVAPRVGLAYAISEAPGRELSVRAAAGMFYSLGNDNSLAATNVYPYVRTSGFSDAPFPGNICYLRHPAPPNLKPPFIGETFFGYTPSYREPKLYQWSVGLEQFLSGSQWISLVYVGSSGKRLYLQQVVVDPNPNFIDSNILVGRGDAVSRYDALQLQYKRRLSRGLEALASYTWAHSIDNASKDLGTFATRSFVGLGSERGDSDFDLRNSFGMALTYKIADLRGTGWSSIVREWNLSTLVFAHGAMPVDVVYQSSAGPQIVDARPDIIQNQPIYLPALELPGRKRINPDAFAIPDEDRQGTLRRNSIRGFPFWQMNFRLSREFSVTNRVHFEWKGESFNLFNHPNFGNPSPYFSFRDFDGSATPFAGFGQSASMLNESLSGSGAQKEFQIGGSRAVQLSLKAKF